ncbi:SRPBCC domain-containing protein [Pelagibius sp. Alg239-R121]|uniref:SRPBCC family protein n=1 Tax=Pelagibius sp. Alg239-R121 TaxID=2993448 RepID=UPI0024A77E29|nr:SRPBCC domain-containing protein [Pelagibius sp. Alg239-R121]
MSIDNYARTITVSASPADAYHALTQGFAEWWTTPDRPIRKLGDRAKFTFPPGKSYWTFEASELVSGERVELTCVEALHLHEGQPAEIEQEWLGSKALWQIGTRSGATEIAFEHVGLNPRLLCYDICRQGWDLFFVDSLKKYLDTGVGKPY